jgi:hypothetical protein
MQHNGRGQPVPYAVRKLMTVPINSKWNDRKKPFLAGSRRADYRT